MQVKKLHIDIQPLKVFHFGGDEVAKGEYTLLVDDLVPRNYVDRIFATHSKLLRHCLVKQIMYNQIRFMNYAHTTKFNSVIWGRG